MSEIKWTTDIPTEPGWYWLRHAPKDCGRIVYVKNIFGMDGLFYEAMVRVEANPYGTDQWSSEPMLYPSA